MSRYQIHRDLDQTLAELEQFANRRTGPRSTPIRPADPIHNALLQNAQDYPMKPAAELGTAIAAVAIVVMFTLALINHLVGA